MNRPEPKPTARLLTAADYMAQTPQAPPGPRYQLIEGQLFHLPTPHEPHQALVGNWLIKMMLQADVLGIGKVVVSPLDVTLDEFNVFQPDVLYVSNERRYVFDGHGITGAPDVVVEILSDPTRRRYLKMKLPIYGRAGVGEIWVMELEPETVTVYSGGATPAPTKTFTADDVLTSDMMPGAAIGLGEIFAEGRRVLAFIFGTDRKTPFDG